MKVLRLLLSKVALSGTPDARRRSVVVIDLRAKVASGVASNVVNSGRIFSLLIVLLAASIATYAQAPDVYAHFDGKAVHLRWRGVRTVAEPRYIVYREDVARNTREKIRETSRTSKATEIRAIAGTKADAYFGLFKSQGSDITAAEYERIFSDKTSRNIFNVIAVATPEFGRILGELVSDSTILHGQSLRYVVAVIENGVEKQLGTSRIINTTQLDVVPPPRNVEIQNGDAQCSLRWESETQAEERGDVVARKVYRAESPLGPFIPLNALPLLPFKFGGDTKEQGFTDEYLHNGTTYYYYVTALNAAGVESLPSVTVEGTPGADVSAPTNLRLQQLGASVLVEWEGNLLAAAENYYEVERRDEKGNEYLQTLPSLDREKNKEKSISWLDNTVMGGGQYSYRVRSVQGDNKSQFSEEQNIRLADKEAPAVPQNLKHNIQQNRVTLSWQPNTEPDIEGYVLERMSDAAMAIPFQLNASPLKRNTYTDTLPPDAQYRVGYVVYAVDKSYNRSAPSQKLIVRLPDKIPPSTPVITAISKKSEIGKNSVELQWVKNTEPDFKEYAVYKRSRGGASSLLFKTTATTAKDENLASGEYFYSVSASDSSGNESAHSEERSATFSSPVPDAPTQGKAGEKNGNILLSWKASPSSQVVGYGIWHVEEDGQLISMKETKKNVVEYTDRLSAPEKQQRYHIRAFDAEGNLSEALVVVYTPK